MVMANSFGLLTGLNQGARFACMVCCKYNSYKIVVEVSCI